MCITDNKFFFYALSVSRGSSSRERSVPLAISPPLAVPPARSSRYKGALDFDSVCLRCFGIPPPPVAGSREHKTSTVGGGPLAIPPPSARSGQPAANPPATIVQGSIRGETRVLPCDHSAHDDATLDATLDIRESYGYQY